MPPTVSVIVATYNGTRQLDRCLRSIIATAETDIEIILADDGTNAPESLKLIDHWMGHADVPITLAKQSDKGFRLARSRNNAVSKSHGDILLFLDHDIILPTTFFRTLRKNMVPGWFAAGRRVKLDFDTTERFYNRELSPKDFFNSRFAIHAFQKRFPGWRYLFPTRNRRPGTKPQPFEGMSGFCIATFRSDFFAVDGFDGAYQSYGVEDWDFLARLINNGTHGGYLPRAATTVHLWHRESPTDTKSPAYDKLRTVIANRTTLPEVGFSKLGQEG